MDFNQLMGKLGRTGQVFVGGALLILIDSFLPWWKASVKLTAEEKAFAFGPTSTSHMGWGVSFGGWFPILLLIAVGVVTVLVALGNLSWSPLMLVTVGTAASLLAFLILLLRWVTYPSAPSAYKDFVSYGASFGTYIALAIALAMTVFGYLGFTAAGGDIKNIGAAFRPQGQVGPPPGQYGPPSQG